jgi:hypothetical protein
MADAILTFGGSCDASGVVDVGGNNFAAGSDETNTIRLYAAGGGEAVSSLSLDGFLKAKWDDDDQKYAECDIEGATRIGDITLWITSHARNSKGKEKPDRQRLFAIRIADEENGATLVPFGTPYTGLLADLLSAKVLQSWPLHSAAGKKPQEEGGLNIEAICAASDGGLYVGFRNPILDGKALLAKIENPLDVIGGSGVRAAIDRGYQLDLGGRGFRDMVRWKDNYLILAGAYNDGRNFALFHWKGRDEPPVELSVDLNTTGLSPEGLVVLAADEGKVLVTSDDDSLVFDGFPNNKLSDERRTFRGGHLTLENNISMVRGFSLLS